MDNGFKLISAVIKFQTGKKYSCRSVCDSECVWNFEVIDRTEKTIKIKDDSGNIFSRKVSVWDNSESIFPLGKYSMAPILRAS